MTQPTELGAVTTDDRPISIGDRVRIAGYRDGIVMVVRSVYLQGLREVPMAACRWKTGAQEIHMPISELVRENS